MSVQLHINGETLETFESGSLALTMEDAANVLSIEYLADGKAMGQRAIFRGDAAEASIDAGAGAGAERVLRGFVNGTDDDDSAEMVRLSAVATSHTADLAKGSVLNRPGRWSNVSLERLVKEICEPFEIESVIEGDQGDPFVTFSVQKGETALDAIARAAIKRGMFPYCTAGDLILARVGANRTATPLVRGDHRLLRSGRSDSEDGRYSAYVCRGQVRPTDENHGANASQLSDEVVDEGLQRYLPLYVQAEAGSKKDLKTRAKLERSQRAGRGERITAVVDGWHTEERTAWRPNTLVRFVNPVLGVDATLLIVRVTFRFGANEPEEAELTMTRPEAFDVEDYPALGRGESWT